jgi:hypothetical protein
MDFCALEESVRAYQLLAELDQAGDFLLRDWWNLGWFPVLHGPTGDLLCVDSAGAFAGTVGQIVDFVHNDSPRMIVAPGVWPWLESYCDFLEDDLLDDTGCVRTSKDFVWARGIVTFPKARFASSRSSGPVGRISARWKAWFGTGGR